MHQSGGWYVAAGIQAAPSRVGGIELKRSWMRTGVARTGYTRVPANTAATMPTPNPLRVRRGNLPSVAAAVQPRHSP